MYRILVADDEPIERMIISQLIIEHFSGQLEIVEAANGREAIELFKKEAFQIVMLDIEMPGITGLEAAEVIRKQDEECSIIFLTAFDYFTYARKAIRLKVLEYLLKPSSDEEIIAVLEEAIQIVDRKQSYSYQESGLSVDSIIIDSEKAEQVKLNIVQEHILEYIQHHYREDISLQDVAGAMHYSDAYFCKLFKQCFQTGLTAYLSKFRVEQAKELLSDITINVKEVSEQVGYRDSNYFAKVFKRIEGITPSEYRMKILENKVSLKEKSKVINL